MRGVLLSFGFILVTYLNYWIFSKVSYAMPLFSVVRVLGIISIIGYYYLLIKQTQILKSASTYLEKWDMHSNGKFFFASIFGIIHLVLISEGTDRYNNYLLKNSFYETVAEIKECKNDYCIYSYSANDQYYEVKFNNRGKGFENAEEITIYYYPKNPLISQIKR